MNAASASRLYSRSEKALLAAISMKRTDDCIIWTGPYTPSGYGRFNRKPAHRAVYELLRDPVPPGLELDHLCRVKGCVNWQHLEPVTHAENVARAWAARKGSAA